MKVGPLLYGISTFVPGVQKFRSMETKGTDSSRYCYSVWLRHLVMAKKNGLNTNPEVIAELGPGDTLGTGLAALISGAERYYAFDVVKFADIQNNLKVFNEIVTLFRQREPIPDEKEWPHVHPRLDSYAFPYDVLDERRLITSLDDSRIEQIRKSIENHYNEESMIQYKVPWYDFDLIDPGTVDMIYSQAVLEHVDDLQSTYKSMHLWLKENGVVSSTIDFRCHGISSEWNGHWIVSDRAWKLLRGKRPYFLNRAPCSRHIAHMKEEGFKIACEIRYTSPSKYSLRQIAPRFRYLSYKDLVTSGTFIQAVKAG